MKHTKGFSNKQIEIFFLFFFLLYYLMKSIALLIPDLNPILIEDLFSMIGEFAAFYLIIRGIILHQIVQKRIWIFFATAILLTLIGDAIWNIHDLIFHTEMSTISICDIFYLPASFLLLFALFMIFEKERAYHIIKTIFDIGIIMIASTTLLYQYILIPIWSDTSLHITQKLILILYPVMDLGYITGILSHVFQKKGKPFKNRTDIFLIIGFFLLFAADLTYSIDSTNFLSFFYYPFWSMGYVSIALASLYSTKNNISSTSQFDHADNRNLFKDYVIFFSPYLAGSFFIILVSAKYMILYPLAFGSIITVLLILLRKIFTLLESKQLLVILEKTNIQLEEYSATLEDRNKTLHALKEKKELEAHTDYLTLLYNRRYICKWLEQYVAGFAITETIGFSVLLMDIDHYKDVNDTWGHDTGDAVLKDIATIINTSIRSADKAGRFGGDEFILILPETNSENATLIANRILHAVSHHIFDYNPDINITLSIGNYYWNGKKTTYSFEQMIKSVDEALYKAKESGKNCIITK